MNLQLYTVLSATLNNIHIQSSCFALCPSCYSNIKIEPLFFESRLCFHLLTRSAYILDTFTENCLIQVVQHFKCSSLKTEKKTASEKQCSKFCIFVITWTEPRRRILFLKMTLGLRIINLFREVTSGYL